MCIVQVTERDTEMVARAIKEGTRQGYQASVQLWHEFLDKDDTYRIEDPFLDKLELSSHTILINRYLDWLIHSKRTIPTVACRMITGVRHHFQIFHRTTAAFDSEVVQKAKKSALLCTAHIRFVDRIGRSGPALPFTIELLVMARISHWESPAATIDMKMTYIGVALGVASGSRPGEIAYAGPYVNDPKYPKAKAEDHRYFTTDLILESQFRPDGSQSIYNFDEARALPWPRIDFELIRLTQDTSKTSGGDTDGTTHYFTRGNKIETHFFNDLVEWLLDLCQLPTGVPGGHMICSRITYFSSRPDRPSTKMLTTKMYSSLIKLIAQQNHLPAECFSGKSPRVNAITSAEMAGADGRKITGHKSSSGASHYLRNIHGSRSSASQDTVLGLPSGSSTNALSIPCLLSVQDLQRSVSQNQRLQFSRRGINGGSDRSEVKEEIEEVEDKS